MMLGISLHTFTVLHVQISLLGILSGLLVVLGMFGGKERPLLTAFFLITTALTSITGFMFPFKGVTPGILIGAISLVMLAASAYARYGAKMIGGWRRTYVVTAVIALYFNMFVLLVQSFEHVPALHAMTPTGREWPFKVSQAALLVLFIFIGWRAKQGFGVPKAEAVKVA